MERHKSALKAARQAVKAQARNAAARSAFRTTVKKFQALVAQGKTGASADLKKQVAESLNEVQKVLMKAASKNLIGARTASRKIGRLSKAAHKALGA